MSRTKIELAAVVSCAAVVASGVFAQDRRAERRERIREAAETAAGVAGRVIEAAEGGDVVAGNVIMLQERRAIEDNEVNNGGLVIIRVPDSGSRPPQDIKVEAGRQYQRLGQVRGVRERGRRQLAGGGYTWILLKPVNEGEGAIVLSYTPNEGGAPVVHEFKVKVTAAEVEDSPN